MTLMKIDNEGLNLIKRFEGLSLKAYKCPAGVMTVGYGHTGKDVKAGMQITERQAVELLKKDVAVAEKVLNSLNINFTQNGFSSLCSFIFNLGAGAFATSTLKKKIVARADDEAICAEIVKWVNAGGKPLVGLKRRRVAEANMFIGRELYKVDMFGKIVRV